MFNAEFNRTLRTLAYAAGQTTGKWWTRCTTQKLVDCTRILSLADRLAGIAN